MIPSDGSPFVLLDDAASGHAKLFRDPIEVVQVHRLDQVDASLDRLRAATAAGQHAAGWLGYEAGYALEPRLVPIAPPAAEGDPPLLWFGLFAAREDIVDLAALLPDGAGAHATMPRPHIARQDYEAGVATLLEAIAAGEIYQANYTFQADVGILGAPLALYARLRRAAAMAWGGVVFTGARWLLSCSPEMMVTQQAGRLTARPMKGTARRAADPARDAAAAAGLAADDKQRAENLMIVDLIRNDLSRIARPGSVAVPALFAVETYPTIHQMTSTVTADLADGRDAVDVLRAMFPCGSVTGAPKLRAMEVLREVEVAPRGPYTGSMGHLGPDGDMALNVAIRTLVLSSGAATARLGLGSAIVADSVAGEEWQECLAKAAFVTAGQRPFDLLETMRFDPIAGVLEIERHLARLKASASALGFAFDRHGTRNEIHAATFRLTEPATIRLRLSPQGGLAIAVTPLPRAMDAPAAVALAPLPVDPADFRLNHKTSDRGFYEAARTDAGTFDVLFLDPDGWLTEGSFTNLFVERDGRLLTPPLTRGLLPGVLRQVLLDEGRAIEEDLRAKDLVGSFFVGNALRGLIPARLAPTVAAVQRSRL